MNIFDPKIPESGEKFTSLLEHKNVRIVRIVSSQDTKPTEYVQDEDEWVSVLQGQATVLVNKTKHTLNKGDNIFIPAKTPHKVLDVADGTIWLAIHID